MNLEGFTTIDFPVRNVEASEFVYILSFETGGRSVPFYVGQTKRLFGRMDDYYWAEFAACTDFRVGEAIKYLVEKGRVTISFKRCPNSLAKEAQVIAECGGKAKLLNGVKAYDYRRATNEDKRRAMEEDERRRLQAEIERIVSGPTDSDSNRSQQEGTNT